MDIHGRDPRHVSECEWKGEGMNWPLCLPRSSKKLAAAPGRRTEKVTASKVQPTHPCCQEVWDAARSSVLHFGAARQPWGRLAPRGSQHQLGAERQPGKTGAERQLASTGAERQPGKTGAERQPASTGAERQPGKTGAERQPASEYHRRTPLI